MSRGIQDLDPVMWTPVANLLELCEWKGLEILIYCTKRSYEEQARVYRQGRSLSEIKKTASDLTRIYKRSDLADILMSVGPQYGKWVTNAAPGQSAHNYGLAIDAVPVRDKKLLWSLKHYRNEWLLYQGAIEEAGLKSLRSIGDWPHAQHPSFDWREEILVAP